MSLCAVCRAEVFEVKTTSGQPLLMDRKPLSRGHYRLAQDAERNVVAIPVPSLYKPHSCPK